MSEMCPPCGIEMFGEDLDQWCNVTALCEGCGQWVKVDLDGKVVAKYPFEWGFGGNHET